LDCRFFREEYNAQRLLLDVVESVRQTATFGDAAAQAVNRLAQALHSNFAVVLVHEPSGGHFEPYSCFPEDHRVPRVPSNSKIVGLVRLLNKPICVQLTAGAWLDHQLPPAETELVRKSQIDQIVPIATDPASTEALLALGPKKSEEPYTPDDQRLLHAIAGALSLRLCSTPVAANTNTFAECPMCGTCYEATGSICPADGSSLKVVPKARRVGRYELERRIAVGGMGAIYQAVDTLLCRPVAIKLIREDRMDSTAMAERFHREAREVAGFSHPNVVTVYDFGISEGRLFLVLELLEGVTLRTALRQKAFSPERTLHIIEDICAALTAAHGARILHRDLKPENIFLVHDGRREIAKVLDFGIAKTLSGDDDTQTINDTGPGVVIGTPRYMAPEQLRGEPPRPSWDLWALAVIAYEMLTGFSPLNGIGFDAGSMPVLEYLRSAPSEWQSFFERALAPDVEKRPASAEEFHRALGAALRLTT
jgi:tRNA A-37 threonylcarbamoyl transferase component Bud32